MSSSYKWLANIQLGKKHKSISGFITISLLFYCLERSDCINILEHFD